MKIKWRNLKQRLSIAIMGVVSIFTALLLVLIIGKITISAIPALNPHFLTTAEVNTPGFGQAIGNSLVGTIVLSLLSVALAIPLAIGTALYLKRYTVESPFTRSISFMIDILAGMPSIILGVFGFLFIVIYLKPFSGGFSLLSGALAMAVLIMPVIERASEEALNTVPEELEDGSYALGGTRWKTIKEITIPYALSGIVTGIVLAIGRSAEESAIVMLTAGYSQFYPAIEILHNSKMPFGIQLGPFQEPIGVLSISVYNMYSYPNIVPRANGFAAALVLIILVMIINIIARLVLWRFRMNKNPAVDSGGSFSLSGLFKKKGPEDTGSSFIPHIGVFNRKKAEPVEKQMESIFPDLQRKPETEEVAQSIRPYLIDPINETPVIKALEPIAANSTPAGEILADETQQSLPVADISPKPVVNDSSNLSSILIPPSDMPLSPVVNTPYSVFVVDPVKVTEGDISKNDQNPSGMSDMVPSPLPAPSIEPILSTAPIQITELARPSLPDPTPVSIHEDDMKKPLMPTSAAIQELAPAHEAEPHVGNSSVQLITKEDKQMRKSNSPKDTANGAMSKTKDGKPFLDLLHPPSANNGKKDIITSSSLVSQVSDIAMPYTIGGGPDRAPTGLLSPGYVELSPAKDIEMSSPQASDETAPHKIISEPASIAEEAETIIAQRPTPDKINDITHKVKTPEKPKAKSASDFDLFNIFGGFKKNGKDHNGNNGNDVKREAATQASPTEDEVKSALQKPAKKNSLLSGLNLNFSKPKEIIELLDFNVGKLSIPTLDGALKETDVTYEIDPPFQYVHVFFDGEEMSYNVLEPKLSDGEKKYLVIIERALEKLISAKIVAIRPEEREDFLRLRFTDIVKMYGFNLNEAHQDRMFYYIRKNYLGLSKIDVIMKDHYIEDVSCNGPNNYLYVYHRVFGSIRTNVSFEELELNKFVMRLAQISGKHISILQPIKDVSMPDGSRANLTMGSEVTKKGATFTIRKFRDKPMSPVELMEYNSIDPLTLAYLWILLDYKKSILVSGGTASGKTTLLNVICSFIRPENKIVSLEDTAELNLVHPNWIQSVTRSGFGAESGSNSVSGVSGVSAKSPGDIGLYDLLVAALRQRPEFIICGEVRGAEAFTMFQAIAVGHACMGTIHAGTMRELLSRIESNPMNVPRTLFSALDVVCFNAMVRHGDRNVRRVMSVVEILELGADGDLVTNPVFRWDAKNDRFLFTGKSHIFEKIETQLGVSEHELVNEMQARAKFLRSLRENNIRDYAAVVEKIHEYTLNHS